MQVTSLIFLLIALPVVFCMLTWVIATVYRLYVPDASFDLERELSRISQPEPSPADVALTVGVREIKEDQRRWQRSTCSSPYYFLNGISNGVPSPWLDDVWQRRN